MNNFIYGRIRPRKVLFLARSMRGGGAEKFLTILLRHIDKSRFLPILGLVEKEGPFLENLPGCIEVIGLNAGRVRDALPQIVALVREKKPDLVFSSIGYLSVAISLIRDFLPGGTKIIARETNIPSLNLKQSPFPFLFSFLYRWFYPRLDLVICQSNDMRHDLVENFSFPLRKTVVINNPVDCSDIWIHAQENKETNCEKQVSILAVGKLMYQKGFDLLLEALAETRDIRFQLNILGEGPEEKRLKQIVQKYGLAEQVNFGGFVSNPYPYMAQADLFVLSSRFEGFPNVVLEALASGTPVVAFDCPGDICAIIQDGVNGWKVEPENTVALGSTIKRALRTSWDEVQIKKSVEDQFGVKKIISEYENVFLQLLDEGPGSISG